MSRSFYYSSALEITLENIGKKYQREWIFRHAGIHFPSGTMCAVLGGNGSGKSTFLQLISGYLSPSEGIIKWQHNNEILSSIDIYRHVSWCTPLLSVYDDLSLKENVDFFLRFRKFRKGLREEDFATVIGLEKQRNKQLKYFSSGMRQRVKLGLAILADSSLLLLDEPVSHLDARAIDWFQQLLNTNSDERSIFIASNSSDEETFLCNKKLAIEEFR